MHREVLYIYSKTHLFYTIHHGVFKMIQ